MIILFAVVFTGIIAATNLLSSTKKLTCSFQFNTDCTITTIKMDMVDLMANRQDTVIFGDSTAASINPKKLNPHVFNFQLSGQTPVQAYYLLKYMINQEKTPKNIILKYTYKYYSRFASNQYWDQIIGFKPKAITRADAKEILDVDKKMSNPSIEQYKLNNVIDKKESSVHIPYYYDLAYGPLMKTKVIFDDYFRNFKEFYYQENNMFESRGVLRTAVSGHQETICKRHADEGWYAVLPLDDGSVAYYLKELVALADKENINVYMLGVHLAESCFEFAEPYLPNLDDLYLKQFKTINFEYAGLMPIPDKLMLDQVHTDEYGTDYYTEKVKPLFDKIQ